MINLFINFYTDNDAERQKELVYCLQRNTDNALIQRIILLVGDRPSFADFFNEVNAKTAAGDINIIANTDIYFDGTLQAVISNIKENECYALSRYDNNILFNRKDSQDCWIFKGKIKDVPDCDFGLGFAGCDNAIAERLHRAGYEIKNPSLDIVTHHVHTTGVRNYNPYHPVPKPYLLITPHKLNGKKILHVALGRQNPEMENAIALLGESKILDWTTQSNIDTAIINECAAFKPDLVFMQLQGEVIKENTLKVIRNILPATILVNWTGDVRENIEWYKSFAKYFHHTLFTNETDVALLRAEGLSSDYMQTGFQERIYCPNGVIKNTPPIVFMANNYQARFPLSGFRIEVVSFLKETYQNEFCLYGGTGINLNAQPHVEAAVYRGAKIGISVSHFNYERYYSDRQLRIMACGCFCLSYHYNGIEKDFVVGEHLDTFKTKEELKLKIDYYLANEDKRKILAANGSAYVLNTCKWEHRINDLKKIIKW